MRSLGSQLESLPDKHGESLKKIDFSLLGAYWNPKTSKVENCDNLFTILVGASEVILPAPKFGSPTRKHNMWDHFVFIFYILQFLKVAQLILVFFLSL